MSDSKSANLDLSQAIRAAPLRADAFWILAFSAFYGCYLLTRVATGSALDLDEAKLPLDAGLWRFGYGVNLPLYTWMQNGVFALFGMGLPAIAFLKSLVLAATSLGLYALARRVVEPLLAGTAVTILYLQPQFSWEAHRTLTHSPLTALAVIGLLLAILRLRDRGTIVSYVLLGAAISFGALSKYNFWLAVPAAIGAGLMDPILRSRLLDRRILVSVALPLLILAGPFLWIAGNWERASGSTHKFSIDDALAARLFGMADLSIGLLSFLAVPALGLALAFAVDRWRSSEPVRHTVVSDIERLLLRYGMIVLGIVVFAVLASGTQTVRERWLYPLFMPTLLAVVLLAFRMLERSGFITLRVLGAAVMATLIVALPIYNTVADSRRAAPFGAIAEDLRARGVPETATIVAPHDWIAGNLQRFADGWIVNDARLLRGLPSDGSPFLLVEEGTGERAMEPRFGAAPCPDRSPLDVSASYPVLSDEVLQLTAMWYCR